jgi:hypothetical protein
MIDNLMRDLQVLRKADFLIGKIWLSAAARRLGFFAFAALIAVFGLGMANIAGFYALQTSMGTVWAAMVIAVVDLAIAALVLLVGSRSHPGPELELAFEVRKMAVESIQADTRDLKLTIEAVVEQLKDVKTNITAAVHNPLDVAAQKILIPAALSLLRGLRPKKEHG